MDEYVPRYKWRRTWGEETGTDGKPHEDSPASTAMTCRPDLQDDLVSDSQWKWNAGYPKQRRGTPALPNAGFADSAREACRLCEEYYDRILTSQQPDHLDVLPQSSTLNEPHATVCNLEAQKMRDWRKYIFEDEPLGFIIATVVLVMIIGATVVLLTAWLLLA